MTTGQGNKFGFSFFKLLILLFNASAAYKFLHIVIVYQLIVNKNGRDKIKPYLNHRFKNSSKLSKLLHTYKIFYNQGVQIIDKYIHAINSNYFKIKVIDNENCVEQISTAKRGSVILISHTGNWQIALSELNNIKSKIINVLIKQEANREVNSILKQQMPNNVNFIYTDQFLFSGIVELADALMRDEVACIAADRHYNSQCISLQFLGEEANFPISPYVLAIRTGSTIYSLFVYKSAKNEYTIIMKDLIAPTELWEIVKNNSVTEVARSFVSNLELFSKDHPHQCFFFTDLWK